MNPAFDINYNKSVPFILEKLNVCILLTTYQASKLIIISAENQQLRQTPITLKKPMGIAIDGTKLAVACIDELRFFSKNEKTAPFVNMGHYQYDPIYLQRATYHTSTLDVHDIAFGDGMIWGINTLFSCISVFDINHSFKPKWKPPYISELVPEDRCHLNGMVMQDGIPKYVTALSKDNEKQGWRKNKLNSGVLIEVPSGDIILSGLSMPHSPRYYENELYLLESGLGRLIKVNLKENKIEVVFDFNCFIRGLTFNHEIAFIGKSQIRETSTDFNHLSIKDNSKNAGVILFCMKTYTVLGEINYTADIQELYDVQVIENAPNALIITNEIEEYNDIITYPGNVFKKKQ